MKPASSPSLGEALDLLGHEEGCVEIPPVDSLRWLISQTADVKTYWNSADGSVEMAGIGVADLLTGDDFTEVLGRTRSRLSEGSDLLAYYGGISFSPESTMAPDWVDYGPCRFLIPALQILRRGGRHYLIRAGESPNVEVDESIDLTTPAVLARTDFPQDAVWNGAVRDILARIKAGTINKIVLARRSDFLLDSECDAATLLFRLRKQNPGGYQFLFQPHTGTAFFGISPESLYRRQGRLIDSTAIAGTRQRSGDTTHDRQLGEELLGSEKDLLEHRYVFEHILRGLQPLCSQLEHGSSPRLIRLPQVQHLQQRLEGVLSPGVNDSQVIRAIHPSPAVSGCPRDTAVRLLAALEPFKRGWYSGVVGCVGQDTADLAVAIRSGLAAGSKLSLFAGAGIVQGSNPCAEWSETESKMACCLDLLKV